MDAHIMNAASKQASRHNWEDLITYSSCDFIRLFFEFVTIFIQIVFHKWFCLIWDHSCLFQNYNSTRARQTYCKNLNHRISQMYQIYYR